MESKLFVRGSEWRKWDLHVHTPESIKHDYSGAGESWSAFLEDIEKLPPEFKVLGINDYIFLDGYRRVIHEKQKNGRLKNIELVLPVIELRLDKFGGSPGKLSKVNFHVIFSDEIGADVIEQQFLNALAREYQIAPRYSEAVKKQKWLALPTRQAIEDLGRLIIDSVPEEERVKFGSPLSEGFNNLCFSLEGVQSALKSHYFQNRFLTAVGKTEWADIKWNDQSIAEKKHIINSVNLVFVSSESPEMWKKAKMALTASGVNDRLLDCSDAHTWSTNAHKDRIGNCFTWIKADPTFEGLKQILNEPEERVFVGELPPKLERVLTDKTRYIQSVSIKKKPGSSLAERWFDNEIPLNCGLVAVIGNKGKGKSAFVDTIGLLGNTRQRRAFSFLSDKGFCNPRDNKGQFFAATLRWESGTENRASLDGAVDETQPELIKYIPQNFLEVICNEIAGENETGFDKELKKVIFSHVPESDRLRHATLDALITFRTEEATSRILRLRLDLHGINTQIVELEAQDTSAYRMGVENRLKLAKEELEAHDRSKPDEVSEPVNDPQAAASVHELAATMAARLEERKELDLKIETAKAEQAECALQGATVEKAISKLAGFQQQLSSFLKDFEVDCSRIGLRAKDLVEIKIDENPLQNRRGEVSKLRSNVDSLLNRANPHSLVAKRTDLTDLLTAIQKQLDEPNRRYQAYLRALESWEQRRLKLIGDESTVSSVKFFEKQLADLSTIPLRLAIEYDRRIAKVREIHTEISRLAEVYRGLYDPVQQFIDGNPIAQTRFQLNFEVAIALSGFEANFESFISHGVAGSFCGVEEGSRYLRNMLQKYELGKEEGAVNFLNELSDSLRQDKRSGSAPFPQVSVAAQLKKGAGQSVIAFYDYIFSLEYLRPRYRLRMGEKELNQLSPGERGTLLLVFYLLIDKEQIPLVIDQPEENLDNQTVFELLVPCIKETKKRRQMVIVTHNPNLAVVCDAEQIICASLDKFDNYRMEYLAGAIENPLINRAVVNILEGTRPAFNNRDSKYEVSK
jgi:hypothetical protein